MNINVKLIQLPEYDFFAIGHGTKKLHDPEPVNDVTQLHL